MNIRCSQPVSNLVGGPAHEAQPLSTLADFLRAFEENTGWPLRFVPGTSLGGHPMPGCAELEDPEVLWAARLGTAVDGVGELRLSLGGSPPLGRGRVDLEVAAALANSYATLLDDLLHTRRRLQQREAELLRWDGPSKTREGAGPTPNKLQRELQLAAETLNSQAAAIYLLDETTLELVLHTTWGPVAKGGYSPRRWLREATADLEAVAGYAVTLESPAEMSVWNVPAECELAVCLPVSSATQVLGTLWVFGGHAQSISDGQVNATEIIAGRIAVELERELRLTAFARETADAVCR